jgi:hypothetical protein
METLGSSRAHFQKYVTNNKRLAEVRFKIAQGKESPVLFFKSGVLTKGKTTYKAGTRLTVLSPRKTQIGGLEVLSVRVGFERGFLPADSVAVPNPGSVRSGEDPALAIDNYILECGGIVDISLKGSTRIYKDLCYAVPVTPAMASRGVGPAKANVVLCKDKRNPTAPGSVYLFHRPSSRTESVSLPYATIAKRRDSKAFLENPSVLAFLQSALEVIAEKTTVPVMSTALDEDLLLLSFYGSQAKSTARSLRHVHAIGSGDVVFKAGGSGPAELSFSKEFRNSGTLFKPADIPPVLAVLPAPGRTLELDGKVYRGIEAGVYPLPHVARRTGLVTLGSP